MRRWTAEYARQHPDADPADIPGPGGADLFGEGTPDAWAWNSLADRMTVPARVWLIADLRRREAAAPDSRWEAPGFPAAAVAAAQERMPAMLAQVRAEIAAAGARHMADAGDLEGGQVFGDGPDDAAIWDAYRDLSVAWRVRTVALARATREAAAASRRAAERRTHGASA